MTCMDVMNVCSVCRMNDRLLMMNRKGRYNLASHSSFCQSLVHHQRC